MYHFTNTTEQGSVTLPKEAVNIDGFFLDREINCFKTLTVNGRDSLEVSIDSYDIPKRNGVKVRNRTLKERMLIIKYAINAKDIEEYYSSMKKLKKHLYKENILKIFFNDEQNVYYEGYLSSINEPESNYIKGLGSFEVICPTPYKYHVNSKKSIINRGKANIDSVFANKIRTLEIEKLTLNSTTMTIGIGEYQMKFKALPTTLNKRLFIDFQNLVVTLGGQVITSNLDILSDFGNVRLRDEDVISCSLANSTTNVIIDVEEYDL